MSPRRIRCAGVLIIISLGLAACGEDAATVVGVDEIPPLDSLDEAELQDLQTLADRDGLSLAESVARYGWRDDFASAVEAIRADHPGSVADAAIVDGATAWIRFVGVPPPDSQARIDEALAGYPFVVVTIESDGGLSAETANEIMVAAYRAVYERSDVVDALGEFDLDARTVVITVAAPAPGATPVSPDALRATAEDGIREMLGPDAVGVMTIEIRQSSLASLGSDD